MYSLHAQLAGQGRDSSRRYPWLLNAAVIEE
jgi:hypothetical protein